MITSGDAAVLSYRYRARDVYLVLAGSGSVSVSVDDHDANALGILGESAGTDGMLHIQDNRLYHIIHAPSFEKDALLQLRFSKGVQAFAFTFGS